MARHLQWCERMIQFCETKPRQRMLFHIVLVLVPAHRSIIFDCWAAAMCLAIICKHVVTERILHVSNGTGWDGWFLMKKKLQKRASRRWKSTTSTVRTNVIKFEIVEKKWTQSLKCDAIWAITNSITNSIRPMGCFVAPASFSWNAHECVHRRLEKQIFECWIEMKTFVFFILLFGESTKHDWNVRKEPKSKIEKEKVIRMANVLTKNSLNEIAVRMQKFLLCHLCIGLHWLAAEMVHRSRE